MRRELKPVHLVVGDEAYAVEVEVKRLVSEAFGGGSPGFNLATYNAEEGAAGAVDQARTVPMMAARRVVVVTQIHEATPELLDELLGYLTSPSPSTVLVLSGAKASKKLENAVARVGAVATFAAKSSDPVRFAVEHARAAGCTLDREAARAIVEQTGGDLGTVRLELDKAIAYVGGSGVIGPEVVRQVCSLVAEAEGWDLTDAVLSRNADRALATAHRLLEDGESEHKLLGLLTWQMRQLVLLVEATQAGRDPRDVGVRMPASKVAAAQRALRAHPTRPVQIYDALLDANRAFNAVRIGQRRVFEALILRLVAPGALA